MKQVILLFILATNILFSQKKDTLNFVEKPKFETKKLIVPLSLMAVSYTHLDVYKRQT